MEVPNFKKSRLSQLVAHGLIISGRGGSKGGGSSRTPVEANDTVNSRAMASVLDLLGEGVIGGLIDGAKSIFLNDTPLQNSDNSYNFSGVTWWFRDGSQDQSVIDGFDFIETPKSVGRQLKQTSQVNVSLDSADSDRVRVVMKFPSLRSIDKKSGDTNGTTVQFKFQIDAGNGGGFVDVVAEGESNATISLTAKKTGVYYRSYVLDLPKPAKAYTLRAIRLTEDHTDNSYLYDDTYIDSIGEIVNTSLNYPNSALVGLKINSEQFGSSMPTRSYLIKGLKIRVPSNYNADTNSYDGNWDGTFKLASSSNPAWILFDLLTNTRYGLGQFVQESMINIGELYQIGRYCDAFVDDGFGGKEKRFAINTQITSRQDAYRVVQDIAGAFRGMVYWAGGMVHITQDSPADPVMLFSNSNVVNGSFAYKGSARKDRYSVALITYNNKEDGYKQSVEYVEDQEAIKRYGIRKTESVAFGCTSRGQAHRVGLWTLYTSRMESDVITFAVGMDSVFLMPGDIVLIADKFRAGRRNSGRIIGYTSNSIKLDAPVDLTSVGNHITFLSAEGKMVGRDILENGKNITTVTFKTALSSNETPVSDAVWVIAQPDLTPLQARVVSVAEGDDGTSFNITAIQNNPTKYEAIDSGAQLIPQNTTVLDPTFSKPSGLAITEGTYLSSPGNLSVSLTATWQGKSAQYYISWRRSDAGNVSNWKSERVTEEQFELRGVAENGQYDFQVYAVSVGGRKTDPISITYKVLGTMTAPDAPTGLTAVGDYRSIVLNWVNPASVDLDHIEVLASKTNDKSKAQLIAKVSGTTFSHNGLEDSVTWYYWVRAANKRGMLSALNSPLATTATTRDVLSFLKNKITESELGQDLIADIDSKAVATEVDAAIEEAKSQATSQIDDARAESANAVNEAKKALNSAISKETTDRTSAIAGEATARAKAIADEVDARNKAIANEAFERAKAISGEADARSKAIADEVSARAKAISDEASTRASAISDSIAVEASNRAKAISDSASSLNAKIEKEVSDRSAAVSALDTKTANAISEETSNRIATIESEARARADGLLQEKNNRQSEIQNLSTQMQTANESLAQQISQIAAGTGEQFDSLNIWYFDTDNEGWTEDDGSAVPMNVTSDGWLKAANSTSTCRSPNNMAIDANAYRFIKLRIKKVGKPVWAGKLLWVGASEQGWSDARSITFDEPEYDANGIATLSIHDIDWRASTTIRRFRFDFLKGQDDKNYLLIDWIAVGRPTPGAGMAALQNEKAARVDADAAEAANRNALAVQMRGSYDGNDLSKVGSGLIFQEQQARVAADKAEATARQSLETKVNDSVSNINKSLDTLSTQDKAMASDITGLKSSLKDKADASALQTLKTSVDQQGSSISTQGQSITKLQNDLNTTNANVGKKADQTALTALQGTVTQQGKDISAANSSITNLKTSLDTTNNNVAKKADATAVNDLTSRVSATEDKASSQADSIVQLNNSLNNAIADTDASAAMPNNLIVNPSFERGLDGYTGRSAATSVVEISTPHGGTRALKVDAGNVSPGQYVSFVQGRTYEIGVWVKDLGATTDNGAGNNKLRIGNSAGQPVFERPYNSGTIGSDWTLISGRWKATETAKLPVTLSNYLTAGSRCFDDFYVIDVTDSVKIDANASALSSLQNTVTQQGKDIASQSTSITSLSNQMVNGRQNMWVRSVYSVQLANNTTEPTFSDINGKAPISIDEVPDAAKLDFASAGSYVIAHYKAFVKVNADTTITMAPGSRVFDDTGAVYVNGVRVAFGNAGWNTVSFDLKAGWSTVEFLVNQWTGQAYINLGFKLSEKVAQLNSALGMNALSNAISAVTSNVSTVGDRVTSTSQSVTDLRNSLEQTNANLANKADAQALSTLQNTVTQQGKDIASASSSIASLQNNLSTTNANVAKKADATALNALQNTVTQQGSSISSQGNSITQLKNDVDSLSIGASNLLRNSDKSGAPALCLSPTSGFTSYELKAITGLVGKNIAVKTQYTMTLWFKEYADGFGTTKPFTSAVIGRSAVGTDSWSLRYYSQNGIVTRDGDLYKWVGTITAESGSTLFVGVAGLRFLFEDKTQKTGCQIYQVKLEEGNKGTSWSPASEDLSDAISGNSQALSSLDSRVTKAEGSITSQGNSITQLQNELIATNADVSKKADASALASLQNTVTQQGKDITSASSDISLLKNSLATTDANVAKKADSSALSSLQSTVTQQGKDISSQGTRVTSIENSLTSGANLIPNAKMLNGAQGWGGSATTVDGYAAVNSAAGWQPQSATFEVTPGDTLDLSMMCLAGQAITVGWGLRFDGPSLSNATIYASNLSYQAGEKKAVSGTFVVPVGATTARLQPNTGATASLTVYNVVVTRRDAGTMANSSAIDSLTSTVQTQGDAISSVGGRTTSLENSLKTTNDNVSKKADSTTVQTLQNTVTQQGKDISAAGTNITSMQASLTRRTVFTVTAKGNGNSVTPGVFDESGKNLFTPGRSWALVTFAKQSDGSTVIATSKTYDVFGSANNGATMSADIEALASGTYVCVLTFDEPSGNRGKILSALESLGGTSEVVNSLPYRGAYILLGRKGMKPGDGLELRAPTGGDGTAHISTSVEFVNGVMMGLGAAGGVMMKADANASAITTLQNTVTQQGKDITSSSSAITSLQNGLVAANSNIDKKADATALQSLQNTVTQQGKDISTQSGNVTNLQNSLSATNTGLANLVADSDASKKIIGNLLTNSSFERGLEGFSGGASFIKVIDAQSPNSGSKILSCGAGTGTVSQSIAVTKDRTYKIGAFARCQSGSVVDSQSNNKLRIGNSSLLADFMFKPTDLPTGSTWKEISGTWKATVSGSVDVSINSSLKSGNQYFDDFYFIDITDIVNINATSNAVASLTSRVTSAEGTVSSHTGSITNLSNSLNSLNNTVSGKADASALQSLQNTVTQQGKDLSSASDSVTDLKSSLNTLKVQSNPWIDGTFETYDNNQQLGGSTAIVTTDFKSSGSKCLKVTRPANTSGNSDKTIGSYSAVRQSAKYRVEFWAMMPASEAPPSGWTVVVGLHSINKDGGNDWQGITFNEAGLGGRDQWVKFTGVVKVSPSVTRSHVWISTRGQSGSNTPGYAVYIDDFVITDITDAADAQATADANATAISSLQTKVSDIDGKVTAQTSQLSSMQSKVDASSSKVDQLSKTISDSQSTQASLNTSLQSQIDAQASANIKNQADLNSATTSIASIKSTQATQATQISAMAKTQTDMTASLNSQSASIQTLQEAVSNNDALNSTWMVKMQTNNNGQKYAAGIALGVDGKNMQSQFLVQADRFALINTSNGNTTTPFVIDNGVTYMNAAYIKDGSIGSAKVGDLMSSGFQENVRGWRISRDGTMNINGSGPGSSRTVITNGKIEVYDSNNRLRVRMGIF
ncbi:phage tail protein [Klebsiella quasipneumoniae]|nr:MULTISPECIES: phage tail protein [Klebsiella]MCP5820088.1 phage tail protein [Klebsiella pneumoniae]MCU8642109.1 phage tail protein [Klebsiella pneumoniae]MCW9369025.1 phage tail protein [Klebsiella quasipneumoniae]SME09754.1 chromosome segregation protein SMC [Klebsiella pneumoniae]